MNEVTQDVVIYVVNDNEAPSITVDNFTVAENANTGVSIFCNREVINCNAWRLVIVNHINDHVLCDFVHTVGGNDLDSKLILRLKI